MKFQPSNTPKSYLITIGIIYLTSVFQMTNGQDDKTHLELKLGNY